MSELIRLIDLAGKDVSALRVDIRPRTSNGSLMYDHQKDGCEIVRLTSVEWKNSDGRRMLYWRWEPAFSRAFRSREADYSGVSHGIAGDYHLEVVPPQDR